MILEQGGLPGGGFVSLTISRPNGDGEIDNALIEETNYSFKLEFGEAFPLAKPKLEPSELFEINNLGGSGTCIGRFLTGDHVRIGRWKQFHRPVFQIRNSPEEAEL